MDTREYSWQMRVCDAENYVTISALESPEEGRRLVDTVDTVCKRQEEVARQIRRWRGTRRRRLGTLRFEGRRVGSSGGRTRDGARSERTTRAAAVFRRADASHTRRQAVPSTAQTAVDRRAPGVASSKRQRHTFAHCARSGRPLPSSAPYKPPPHRPTDFGTEGTVDTFTNQGQTHCVSLSIRHSPPKWDVGGLRKTQGR